VKLFGRSKLPKGVRRANLDARVAFDLGLLDGKAPTEFCVFKKGLNPSTKGTFLFDDVSAELVMQKYAERGVPMMMDYEHQSRHEPPIEAPASAKQAVPQVRDGELWLTDILWTDRARQYLEAGEYRLFSPAFGYDELDDGTMRVTMLINVALTNDPALHNIEPLVAAASAKEDDMDELAKALADLKASNERCTALQAQLTALDAKLSAALKAKKDDEPDEDDMRATTALRAEVRLITGKDDHREAIGVLRSIKLKADSGDQAVAQLNQIQTDTRESEFVATLSGAIEAGKIPPAQRAFWEASGKKDGKATVEGLAMLKNFVATAPVLAAGSPSRQQTGKGSLATAEEKLVMERFGIVGKEVKSFEEFRADQATK
jgi:phage I-like protein